MIRTLCGRTIAVAGTLAVALLLGTACGSNADRGGTEVPGVQASPATAAVSAPAGQAKPDAASAKDMSADPCKIVTPADLGTVRNGVTYTQSVPGEPQIVGSFSERSCAYESPDGGQVLVTTKIDDAPAGTVWQAILPILTGSPHDVVSGIGDEAILEQESGITVRKGKVILEISFLGEQLTATVKRQLKELATRAAAKM